MNKYSDNAKDIKPEFVGDDGEQYAIKPQDDDKMFKYTKKEMVNLKSYEDFKKEYKKSEE